MSGLQHVSTAAHKARVAMLTARVNELQRQNDDLRAHVERLTAELKKARERKR